MGTVTYLVLFLSVFPSVLGDEHSLFYLFTVHSDLSVNNIYQFSVETLLDDTQLDSYSSRDGIRTPQQSWVKEIEESVWRTGTEKLKDDGYLLHEFLNKQMKFSGHDPSERHVLQWRLGCEGETLPDGSVSPLNCINDLHYDGEDLISYNWTLRKWTVSASQSSDLEKKWNNENRYLHSALSKKYEDCLKWLRIYLRYNPTPTKPTVPDVYVFEKKSQTESSRLTLTCLATGFYPKDLKMRLRRFTTSLPDHLLTSSGVRPNGDGTYQLRKSVDVQEEDTAGYNCCVEHSSFNVSVIKPWEDKHSDYSGVRGVLIGAVVGVLLVTGVGFGLILKKFIKGHGRIDSSFIKLLIGLLLCFMTVGVFICGMILAFDEHSLVFLFTVQSDLSVNNTYQFSVETLLDDTQTDSYSSRDGIRTPKQSWVKEIEEREWKAGTEKLKYDGKLLKKFLDTQMKFSGHDPSERHVLQWRLGCEGETLPDGSVSPVNCINDLHYDGEDLISYNWTLRKWRVSASQSSDLEKRWNNEKGDLQEAPPQKCEDCKKWLKTYFKYNTTDTRLTVPDVYVKKSQTESSRLTLTCLATGFYPKDLKMRVRRFTTSLPDHLLTSSGVRPNGDGTYQLRKSVDVQEEDTAGYDCSVEHNAFNGSVIKPWDGTYSGSSGVNGWIIGGGVVVVVVLLVSIVIGIIVYKRLMVKVGDRNSNVDSGMGSTESVNTRSSFNSDLGKKKRRGPRDAGG
ncbi:uncharacterized protein [Hoplias malabaricus]|uniref:uncharacterized protein isoform X2 n=1 Tax=Hoplias malabaricus TaxID=27720 RepID=UPI0034623EEC